MWWRRWCKTPSAQSTECRPGTKSPPRTRWRRSWGQGPQLHWPSCLQERDMAGSEPGLDRSLSTDKWQAAAKSSRRSTLTLRSWLWKQPPVCFHTSQAEFYSIQGGFRAARFLTCYYFTRMCVCTQLCKLTIILSKDADSLLMCRGMRAELSFQATPPGVRPSPGVSLQVPYLGRMFSWLDQIYQKPKPGDALANTVLKRKKQNRVSKHFRMANWWLRQLQQASSHMCSKTEEENRPSEPGVVATCP